MMVLLFVSLILGQHVLKKERFDISSRWWHLSVFLLMTLRADPGWRSWPRSASSPCCAARARSLSCSLSRCRRRGGCR
jgi:hypothetical protein